MIFEVLEILGYIGAIAFIGAIYWIFLMVIATNTLLIEFGVKALNEYLEKLENNDDVSYA